MYYFTQFVCFSSCSTFLWLECRFQKQHLVIRTRPHFQWSTAIYVLKGLADVLSAGVAGIMHPFTWSVSGFLSQILAEQLYLSFRFFYLLKPVCRHYPSKQRRKIWIYNQYNSWSWSVFKCSFSQWNSLYSTDAHSNFAPPISEVFCLFVSRSEH